jgi:hypothetical protein
VCRLKDSLDDADWLGWNYLRVIDADLDGLLCFALFVYPVVNL